MSWVLFEPEKQQMNHFECQVVQVRLLGLCYDFLLQYRQAQVMDLMLAQNGYQACRADFKPEVATNLEKFAALGLGSFVHIQMTVELKCDLY